MSFIAQFQTFV